MKEMDERILIGIRLVLALVKHEVTLLVEEKIKLCEKIGSLTESCSLKDHLNE